MAAYSFYVLSVMNEILDARTVECGDDESAVEQARLTLAKRTIEVWQGERKVARLEPTDHISEPSGVL